MVWSQIDITKPHLVYIILGGFTSLFMLCSTVIKERMYIGEATVATLCGVIFGPHAANLIDPSSWGSVDIVTLEFSRIVLVVQCFAVGVELPKFYMEKHWRSVIFLLVPVMIAGWLLVSVVIWWMMPGLNWLEALVVSACVTATDPVLASSVVGKGKFAKRVPKHLRDLLSAESGCNDGMAFPFIYLSLYLIQYKRDAAEVSFHFIVYVVLYECVFGAVYGFLIGYIARHGIKYAEKHELIDRESFLVFYFVVALFCAGSGSILGVDDLLVGFAAGVGFSNDGWFGEKTEASHVSNVIDLLLNLTYFVYFGTIIPWEQYNSGYLGLNVWRLVVIAIFVIFFRRIPIMMALKPFIPDIKSWREALFAGHFGPIGVGAIFIAILARAELEHGEPVPLSELPPEGSPHYNLIYLVWPIVTFLVISSILVHGSSIAVFTLGKHINTLTLTMSYTAAPEDGPTWMNRLPRISSQSRSQARTMSEASFDDFKEPEFPAGTLAPPFNFLRRQKDSGHNRSGSRASSVGAKKRKSKKWDDGLGPGGPVSQSAIFPNRQSSSGLESPPNEKEPFPVLQEPVEATSSDESPGELEMRRAVNKLEEVRGRKGNEGSVPSKVEIYDEGDQLVFENQDGEVLDVQPRERKSDEELPLPNISRHSSRSEAEAFNWSLGGLRRKVTDMYSSELEKRKDKDRTTRRHEPARAYQFGNMIIVEDEDGEVVKTYELPSQKSSNQEGSDLIGSSLKYLGLGSLARQPEKEKTAEAATEEGNAPAAPAAEDSSKAPVKPSWVRRLSSAPQHPDQQQDDKQIRFTIGGVGRRMTKEDFINEVQNLDAKTRKEVVDHSNASSGLKRVARGDPPTRQQSQAVIPKIVEHESENNGSRSRSTERNRSNSSSVSPRRQAPPSSQRGRAGSSRGKGLEEPAETAVERKRRLAVLAAQAEDEDDAEGSGSGSGSGGPDVHETPAERRRREAALGVGGSADTYDSDSDDEGIPRVPPVRKGIRFAEDSRKSKK